MPASEVFCMDCMDYMKQYPDKYFQLAVVDPPYGLGDRLSNGGGSKGLVFARLYDEGGWVDSAPTREYFDELYRVSKNQIIWGGNYFPLPPLRGFIFWDKMNPVPNYSDGELAWTSFDRPAKKYQYGYTNVINYEKRIHPTQKPIALYKWLLFNYAKPGDKILDTHLGSGSSRIAAYDMGFDFYGTELDPDYFAAMEKRFTEFKAQLVMDFGGASGS